MPKIIIWSSFAEEDLNGIVAYLLENWNKKITLQYINHVENLVAQIGNQPNMYPVINNKLQVRKCVLTKQN